MSFVNKIKGWGKGNAAEHDVLEHDAAFADAYAQSGGSAALAPPDLPLPDVDVDAPFDVEPAPPSELPPNPSIISAAVPSEIADFTETRLQGADTGVAPAGTTLPLIGQRPVAEQQRILLGLLGLGLIGLIVLTVYSFISASRGSAQVGATGQALMQSQRLAKSVSQAVVGSASAFPEVKESVEILASNVRSLKTGQGNVAAVPSGAQEALDAVVPLVDRAEKNANVIVAQQKALTEVGQSLRAINRQSFDLLEAAEAILSMKLQRDVNPIEVSALSQIVMLTQRIGKSANEFLTAEGVNP
ncbi:MAG: type IV pili methyl-accepting chemotaxis transducer N-terminal domain-containing protein, partial [Caldimonas sp.]